jgi:hypothetical protein
MNPETARSILFWLYAACALYGIGLVAYLIFLALLDLADNVRDWWHYK